MIKERITMKEYETPVLNEIKVQVEDVFAESGQYNPVLGGDNKGGWGKEFAW